jgi:hypothetical protein
MTRLLPPEIIQDMKQLRIDVDQLKQAQLIGADSLLGYITYSANQNDYSFALAAYAKKTMILTFTPTNPSVMAIVELMLYQTVNQPNVLPNAVPPWSDSTYSNVHDIQKLLPIGNSSRWWITANDSSGAARTSYLKFVFNGTDTGT